MEAICKQRKNIQRSKIKSAFAFQKYHVSANGLVRRYNELESEEEEKKKRSE